jgi:hypothetical protein
MFPEQRPNTTARANVVSISSVEVEVSNIAPARVKSIDRTRAMLIQLTSMAVFMVKGDGPQVTRATAPIGNATETLRPSMESKSRQKNLRLSEQSSKELLCKVLLSRS